LRRDIIVYTNNKDTNLTTHNRIKNSLTAAALATLLTLGGASAAMAESSVPGSSDGSNVSRNYESPKATKDGSGDKVRDGVRGVDRGEQKRKYKSVEAKKRSNSEQKAALKEFKAEHMLIQKEFKLQLKEAQSAFKAVAENELSTEEELAAAEVTKKAAFKAAQATRKADLKELRLRMEAFYKELGIRTPKL
jgi:hypothetical protein